MLPNIKIAKQILGVSVQLYAGSKKKVYVGYAVCV